MRSTSVLPGSLFQWTSQRGFARSALILPAIPTDLSTSSSVRNSTVMPVVRSNSSASGREKGSSSDV